MGSENLQTQTQTQTNERERADATRCGPEKELRFRAHPLVRLERSGARGWLISRDDSLRGHKIAGVVAGVLTATFNPKTAEAVDAALGVSNSLRILEWLRSQGYVTSQDDAAAEQVASWVTAWTRNNWRAASRYHARTYGYPFEFYESDGSSDEDVRRMVSYNGEAPDTERGHRLPKDAKVALDLPRPDVALNRRRFEAVVGHEPEPVDMNSSAVANMLTLLTRPVRQSKMPYPEAADLLRKTSPSGGSRHPTEFAIITRGITGLDDGIYEVATIEGALWKAVYSSDEGESWAQRTGLLPPEGPWFIILYNSYFARNRYRYREPRTFRTVHMDVGHLMGTAEILGRANGWAFEQKQSVDGSALAIARGEDPREEATIAATLFYVKNPS